MGRTRIDLLTVSAGLSLFFCDNAIETLHAASTAPTASSRSGLTC
jgi:hypothetical protein